MGLLGKLFGRDPEKLYAQTMELVDQGRYDEAVQKLEVAVELDPDSPAIWFSLGVCYSRLLSGGFCISPENIHFRNMLF